MTLRGFVVLLLGSTAGLGVAAAATLHVLMPAGTPQRTASAPDGVALAQAAEPLPAEGGMINWAAMPLIPQPGTPASEIASAPKPAAAAPEPAAHAAPRQSQHAAVHARPAEPAKREARARPHETKPKSVVRISKPSPVQTAVAHPRAAPRRTVVATAQPELPALRPPMRPYARPAMYPPPEYYVTYPPAYRYYYYSDY